MHIHISESFSGADENLSLIGRVLEREKKNRKGVGHSEQSIGLADSRP